MQVNVPEPAMSLLSQTLLGAITLLALAITVAAIFQLIKLQNLRVEDQKQLRAEYKTLLEKNEKLTDRMITAFSEMKSAIAGLRDSDSHTQTDLTNLKSSVDGMKATVDLMVLQRSGPRDAKSR